ncbi:hypothetical protein AB6Q13_07670 [Ralstonia solanacearum]|uniref:hypothetical protein n=1 Tax=Ralstonia solanacearum TaxID=305 RepID=UPI002305D13F|nr:hypothetical protein [Ralstonia solanacearum]MDB0566913.1 hypothetical protein [Ralstonia solanacearum]MDB0576648.1 hypothetical protein [Ralstonia solanacearum]
MVISFTDCFGIPKKNFDDTGAFDPVLSVDTRLFIDPSLLRRSATPELAASYESVSTHFGDVLRIIAAVQKKEDVFWRTADKKLTFPEVNGLCIGYAKDSTGGSGMGPKLRAQLLGTMHEIVQAGVNDPALFELVGAFEKNIGPDRISDMIARIIIKDLIAFTQRICSDCGVPMEALPVVKGEPNEDMPKNPITGDAIILVPRDVLRDLPETEEFGDIYWVAQQNEQVRNEMNRLVGDSWSKASTTDLKHALRRTLIDNPEGLRDVIKAYMEGYPDFYDFLEDRSGEVGWYRASRQAVAQAPLSLKLSAKPSLDEVETVVLAICHHFKRLLEDNQLCKLLYDKGGQRKHESAAQLLFFGVASAYCRANDLELSPESDAGRGPVDFKVSSGFQGKVLVEVKLTSNQQLVHGFEKQLPIYQQAEDAQRGIYLVIDNGGASDARLDSFKKKVIAAGGKGLTVVYVDGNPRPSASKADF